MSEQEEKKTTKQINCAYDGSQYRLGRTHHNSSRTTIWMNQTYRRLYWSVAVALEEVRMENSVLFFFSFCWFGIGVCIYSIFLSLFYRFILDFTVTATVCVSVFLVQFYLFPLAIYSTLISSSGKLLVWLKQLYI